MTSSVLLASTAAVLQPLLLVASVFLLIRGHNEPGGGFVGGLFAAAAVSLQMISQGAPAARRTLRVEPATLLGAGLLLALLSGIPSMVTGQPFLTASRLPAGPLTPYLTTVLLFDLGVYLVVLGTVTLLVFTLAEEES